MSLTVNAPTTNVVSEYYGLQWVSKNETAIIKPEVRQQLYRKYGKGIGIRDLYFAAGKSVDVPNQTITILQEESPLAVAKLGAAISVGAAGASISFTLDATMYDTNDNGPLRVGWDVYIPAKYQFSGCRLARAYRVMTATGTGVACTYVAEPYTKTGTYQTASEIATEVPTGENLIIGASSFAAGAAGPVGQTDGFETMSFQPRILREAVDYEGGTIAKSYYPATGFDTNVGVLNSGIMKTEFKLDVQEARYFAHGEWADNTSLVQTAESGASNSILSGGGLFPHADVYAMKKLYSGDFSLDDLYDVKILQESQGLVSTGGVNLLVVGPSLAVGVEKAALEYIKAYSGGTDLLDKVKKELGIDVQAFKIAQMSFVIWQPKELSDPTGFGGNVNGTYSNSLADYGLIIPDAKVTVPSFNGQSNVTIDNVQIGYVNWNGENRKRILGRRQGLNGVSGYNNGNNNSSYDGLHVDMLVHMTGIFALPQQWILMYK